MSAAHDRGGFLREALRGAARVAVELGSTARAAGETAGAEAGLPPLPTVPAAPVTQLASGDELLELAAAAGLEEAAAAAAAAARTGLRLTASAGGGSRLGGVPVLPQGLEWPLWRGEELAFLAELRLDELPESPLPRAGRLLVFFALRACPSGLRVDDAGACRIVVVDGDEPAERPDRLAALPERCVAASAELTLPLDPRDAGLGEADAAAWEVLRGSLAALQGVAAASGGGSAFALHRLLGHPDADGAAMRLDAELLANGIDAAGGERHLHPLVDRVEADARDWLLLLQLSPDDDLGLAFGGRRRLYVWIREHDLAAARFDDVRAFVR